jgi:hypothetical protein
MTTQKSYIEPPQPPRPSHDVNWDWSVVADVYTRALLEIRIRKIIQERYKVCRSDFTEEQEEE